MNEQQFIYGRLHYLNEQVEHLAILMEKQQDLIGRMFNVIEQMQSPEYARKQSKMAEMVDVAEKIEFIRKYSKK